MKVTPISPPRRQTTWHCRRAPLSQEMELVWYLHTVGKQPGALLGNVGDMQSRGSAPDSVWNFAIRLMAWRLCRRRSSNMGSAQGFRACVLIRNPAMTR